MTYLGMKFKNYEEFYNWKKEGHVRWYKTLMKVFINNPTMECSSRLSDQSVLLHDKYGLSWDEIEEIEISCYC